MAEKNFRTWIVLASGIFAAILAVVLVLVKSNIANVKKI